ncbi:MAG: aromatic ring-hydroxylating dioxygenase subunit alpha [Pseudomonadota bacterium]
MLSLDEVRAVNAPIASAIGLPNRAYVGDEFYSIECQHVMGAGWIGIAFENDVVSPGDLFPVEAAGQPLVVVRDNDDKIRVFHNVCRHRGTTLVDQPCSKRQQIVCPYHAWTYALNGELNATPNFRGPEVRERVAFPRGSQDLVEVRSAIWNHIIMVNLSGSAVPLSQWTQEIDQRWSGYDFADTFPGYDMTYDIDANWKLTLENFLESYHLPTVHPGLNAYSPLHDHEVLVQDRIMGQISLNYQPDDSGKGLPCFPDLPDDRRRRAEYLLLFPNLMLSVTPDHFRVTLVLPSSPRHTHQRWRFFFVGEDCQDDRFSSARTGVANRIDTYTQEDIAILERLQAGRHSSAYDGGRFSPYHETTTHHFQKLVANAIEAAQG